MPYTAPVDGMPIYYEIHGDGPAVVLVPGGGGNHGIWWQSIPHFSNQYAMVCMDPPGKGLSRATAETPTFDVTEWWPSILAVLDDAGIERAAVVGQSIGGWPTLDFAVRNRDRVAGVVLTSSVGGISDPEFHSVWLNDRIEAEKMAPDRRVLRDGGVTADPKEQEKVALFREFNSFNQGSQQAGNITGHHSDKGAKLDQLREVIAGGAPIWFLWGDSDRVRPASTYRLLEEMLPEAHFEMIPGAGHSFYWEQPAVYNDYVGRALAAIFAGRNERTYAGSTKS